MEARGKEGDGEKGKKEEEEKENVEERERWRGGGERKMNRDGGMEWQIEGEKEGKG